MAKCMCCNASVSSGFVVCGDCAEKVKNGKVPLDTMRFIGKLAEEISSDDDIYPCTMCNFKCHGGEDAKICPEGIKAWLTDKAISFFGTERSASE